MPVEPKGSRLWFKRGNKLADGSRAQGYWVITDDGGVKVSTGIRAARRGKPPQEAQDALAAYIVGKRQASRERSRDAAALLVADVINVYLQDRALYIGTRVGAVCGAFLIPATHTGWVDLDRGVFYRKASPERETKKRKPPVRLPSRLLARMRRWHKNGQMHAVEWLEGTGRNRHREGVQARLRGCWADGCHTPDAPAHCATWLMQRGTDMWEAAGYLGMATETLEKTYGHHHPEYRSQAAENVTRKA